MAPITHPLVNGGWFREENSQWPGQALSLKVRSILHTEKSLYQDVLVFDSETYGNVLVLDGVVQCTERDEFSYQEMITHLPLASHPDPKHVLVIGGGDGGVVREVLKHKSVEHVTLCDIDEAVVRVSKEYLPHMSSLLDDPRVTVFIGDGFKFLPEHENSYDVIITDSSDPVGPAAALFEAPYFTLLQKALKEGGNMSTQGECLWLHLPLIKELRETTKRLFPVAEYAYTTIPTYPSGQIGFVVCSKDKDRKVNKPLRPVPDCKYYNSEVHAASFVLPEFGRAMVEEGKMIQPTFGGVRPGQEGEEGSGVVGGTLNKKEGGKESKGLDGKKVLLLGSGFVAGPCAEYITRNGIALTVACRTLATAETLCSGLSNATPISLDVNDTAALDSAIASHDLVISLIPYTYHAAVIESACKSKTNVVTTSYISPAMKALEQKVLDAGIVVYNEIGLDPGLDHTYAVKAIHEAHAAGGKILSFRSFCGGLMASSCEDNALGYKLSWSARGVLLALRNNASYLKDGKKVEVEGKNLMAAAEPFHYKSCYNLVAYPNRDSTPFRELYNIPEAQEVIRGTLRFAGFPEVITAFVEMGFLDDTPKEYVRKDAEPLTWLEVTAKTVGSDASVEAVVAKLKSLKAFSSNPDLIIAKMKSLDLFSSEKVTPRGNILDTLCATLETKLAFLPGESDLVILQHKFVIENKDGSISTLVSEMEREGVPNGASAMAYTVGVPCGIATKLVLNGTFSKAGIHAPYDEESCAILREEMAKEGIKMVEKYI